MKALVLTQYRRFEIQERPLPEIGPGEVRVQVGACGICGSDVHGMDGSTGRRQPPIVMGHEAAGTITATGPGVEGWSVGDRVTFDSTIYCGECWYCRRGEINLCDRRRVLGVSCDDYRRDGAFADYVAVPERVLYRLPERVCFEHAALIEPVSIALHAVRRTPVVLNDTAVVVGAGMIGLFIVQALRAAGCGQIIAVDLSDARLTLAGRLGADAGLRSDQCDVAAEVAARTEGRGADIAVEAVGVAATLALAARSVRKGGHLTLVGNLAPKVDLPLQSIVTREITLAGSCASQGEYPACLELMARGAIQVEPLITAVAPLSEGPRWFERLHANSEGLMKVVLVPSGQ